MTAGAVRSDETLDPLGRTGLQLIQPRTGYRFSLDPVLLCAFCQLDSEQTIVDLGCGNGVMPLLLAAGAPSARIVGIERQPEMVDRAQRSVILNGLEERIEILTADLRQRAQLPPAGVAELVVMNPPFRKPGSGRLAKGDERSAARHELAGGLEDFLAAAKYLLNPGGRLCLIHLPQRLPELLGLMGRLRLEPKRLRLVHSRAGEEASLVLVEGRRDARPGLAIEAPLMIYEGDVYSEEIEAIYGV